jgi:hypothetical protein
MALIDTKYGSAQKIAALSNDYTLLRTEFKQLRAEFYSLQLQMDALLDRDKKGSEYIAYLKDKIAQMVKP